MERRHVARDNKFLSAHDFATVIRLTPLVAIDLLLMDGDGAVLVGPRINEPAKGFWFVPGGRIAKDETLDGAFARILKAETGLVHARKEVLCLGVYEHFYDTNRFEESGFGTHYVVIGYKLALENRPSIVADDQHRAMRWMKTAELMGSPDVHENTKAYFRSLAVTR